METAKKDNLQGRALFGACCAVFTVLLLVPVSVWQFLVNTTVQEPYLDEVFHVRQAQVYCKGNLQEWDPKITTPPGLYFINYALRYLGAPCSIPTLRLTNALFLVAGVFPVAFICRSSWAMSLSKADWARFDASRAQRLVADAHAALNVALFPPLFFFSGLYYTDIASTAVVLATWMLVKLRSSYAHDSAEEFLKTVHVIVTVILLAQGQWVFAAVSATAAFLTAWPLRPLSMGNQDGSQAPVRSDSNMRSYICLMGVVSLTFRQTNIFWIAVFPAALALLESARGTRPQGPSIGALLNESAFTRTFYNPSIADASMEDMLQSLLSMVSCVFGTATFVISHPLSVQSKTLLGRLFPFIALLAIFVAFVVINGGIVLGDKSNHVATIHLPQMLYLWPYMAFFSAPLILPNALAAVLPSSLIPGMISRAAARPRISVLTIAAAALGLSAAIGIVHFNTIVHPFTLADNRHYVFYVFRLLRLNPVLYYLATPVYLFCSYLVIQSLGTPGKRAANDKSSDSTAQDTGERGARINFLIVWVATTALCLVGAPLVEPRYFILPWIMWRLEVPSISWLDDSRKAASAGTMTEESKGRSTSAAAPASLTNRTGKSHAAEKSAQEGSDGKNAEVSITQLLFSDYRLWLETGWHLAINIATGYIFLYRGFEWPQEPGNVQRFLW